MVAESAVPISFSDLSGKTFEVYLGSILYEVSLGSYQQFIRTAPDSNELHNFLVGVKNLQQRLDLYRERLEGTVVRAEFSETLYKEIPDDRQAEAREYLPRLAFTIEELKVTELEFIEGSVKGRVRIVLKGVVQYIPVVAGAAAIVGVSLSDFIREEKEQIHGNSCISFGNIEGGQGGNININIDVNNPPRKPDAMQAYMSSPERVERDLFALSLKEVGVSRPRPRPAARQD